MPTPHHIFNSLQSLALSSGETFQYYSLAALEQAGIGPVAKLPLSIRIILESVLRNYDGKKITESHIRQLANWHPAALRNEEIPFVVARVILQDFTGVPLLADLAAMRNIADQMGKPPKSIEPLVPVDLVIDHSIQVDVYGTPDALEKNMQFEFQRNSERYAFMKWGMQAFDTFKVVPPGIGIVHQVNLEYLFQGVQKRDGVIFPDTLVGTDSHTTMINGVGAVGWGVGGIEAEAAMLGQPVYLLTPDVIGVELKGRLREGITATDLVLTVTEALRREKVVGKFVEFFGTGTASLTVTDRATIANMAPEYGATIGLFPIDEQTVAYLRNTGRTAAEIEAFEAYFRAQGLFGTPTTDIPHYTKKLSIDLNAIVASLAGPKRPQDRVELPKMRENFTRLFEKSNSENGFNKKAKELNRRYPTAVNGVDLGQGDILIAAITSCTNTSNPGVMLAAGLLAKKAFQKGLSVKRHIKTSLAPGSRVVTEYLRRAELLEPLARLGFVLVGYGCTTCIGNAGDLSPALNEAILEHDIVAAAVLSGNRNFEARIHPNIRANFLASPPLVVAFALAGTVNINLETEPIGIGAGGEALFLRDIWPTNEEISNVLQFAADPKMYQTLYKDMAKDLGLWKAIPAPAGQVYSWPLSTYIAKPPFFENFSMTPQPLQDLHHARALLLLGNSVTTDHISPAGAFQESTPAGRYLREQGVEKQDFNSYGSRRGNHHVMVRGTFANIRVKNLMLPAEKDGSRVEGGYTLIDGKITTVYEAAVEYQRRKIPTVIFAGEEYGTGSSRDWAAKGTLLLGVKAVIALSFERIHRSNLVGMGILPLQFKGKMTVEKLQLTGQETFSIVGIEETLRPQQDLSLIVHRPNAQKHHVLLLCRIDTPIEIDYFKHGGILPYVLRGLMSKTYETA